MKRDGRRTRRTDLSSCHICLAFSQSTQYESVARSLREKRCRGGSAPFRHSVAADSCGPKFVFLAGGKIASGPARAPAAPLRHPTSAISPPSRPDITRRWKFANTSAVDCRGRKRTRTARSLEEVLVGPSLFPALVPAVSSSRTSTQCRSHASASGGCAIFGMLTLAALPLPRVEIWRPVDALPPPEPSRPDSWLRRGLSASTAGSGGVWWTWTRSTMRRAPSGASPHIQPGQAP